MIDKATLLNHYKRKEIQEEIVYNAKEREVAARFNDKFGQRPESINYPADVLEFAKQGATSFHASEELWKSPLQLSPEMKRKDLQNLRKGWDLILDIDCPYWKLSKIITWLIVKSLRDHNIESISIKFSGNKGFHIGVPFETFPETISGKETESLFPELPKAIATFLLDKISEDKNYTKVNEDNSILFGNKYKISLEKLKEITSKSIDELTKKFCSECDKEITKVEKRSVEFICPKCQSSVKDDKAEFMKCEKCNVFMEKIESKQSLCDCGSNKYYRKFNALSIIDVDTLLISSRHLYRMPYSLHEKSGLVSRPFNPDKVMNFEKKYADPANAKISKWKFLDKENVKKNEMEKLALMSLEFMQTKQESEENNNKQEIKYEDIDEVPEHLFPPCIQNIKKGLEDGRKRSLFMLTNFLTSVGWSYEKVEEFLKEWNNNNKEHLREVLLVGQVRYHKQQKKRILPPNCSNKMYYVDIGICKPDNLCNKIKNPVSYARRKGMFLNKGKKVKKDNKD